MPAWLAGGREGGGGGGAGRTLLWVDKPDQSL